MVIGIDVGGSRRGYHAVALSKTRFVDRVHFPDAASITDWCTKLGAQHVAVDAPCGWSVDGKSRQAERDLARKRIGCFYTPTRSLALGRDFYEWVFQGERLYQRLSGHYQLYEGEVSSERMCIETFPHAIVCALAGEVVRAKPKVKLRRAALRKQGFDDSCLPNIDFVDAALCALVADRFECGEIQTYGTPTEGLIVVPSWS